MKLINAKIKDINFEDSSFNVLLSFKFKHKEPLNALLFCRVEGESVEAYNIGFNICPCCLKPYCYSFYTKRHELLNEALRFIEIPQELFKKSYVME